MDLPGAATQHIAHHVETHQLVVGGQVPPQGVAQVKPKTVNPKEDDPSKDKPKMDNPKKDKPKKDKKGPQKKNPGKKFLLISSQMCPHSLIRPTRCS